MHLSNWPLGKATRALFYEKALPYLDAYDRYHVITDRDSTATIFFGEDYYPLGGSYENVLDCLQARSRTPWAYKPRGGGNHGH